MAGESNYVAFFDMDDTILSVNSGKILIKECYRQGVMSFTELMNAYLLSILHKLRLKSSIKSSMSMIKWLKGTEVKFMEDFAENVVRTQLFSLIRPSIVREIEMHKKKGAKVVMLSAAMKFVTRPIGEKLGFDDIICSELESADGIYTGNPKGNICIDDEKESRVNQYCKEHSFAIETSYYYGDSYSDRFVMKAVGNPVSVLPDSRLTKISKERNWPIISQ